MKNQYIGGDCQKRGGRGLILQYTLCETGILNDKVQPLEVENSFLKNEIHELTTLLNTITTSLSCKSKTTERENTLHEKSDC